MSKWNKISRIAFAALLLCVSSTASAGLFTRARTEAHRLGVVGGSPVQPVQVSGLAIYSLLQDAASGSKRLSKDAERFRVMLAQGFVERGLKVFSVDPLASGTELPSSSVVRHTIGPIETGSVKVLSDQAKSNALELARSYRAQEAALPATHRLVLLPERLTHNTGMSWTWQGPQATGVNAYSFKVYWLLEDAADRPVVAGSTTATLDVRGFPAKDMVDQIITELERQGVQWSKSSVPAP